MVDALNAVTQMIFDHSLLDVGHRSLKVEIPWRGLRMRGELGQGQNREGLTRVLGLTKVDRSTPERGKAEGRQADEQREAAKSSGARHASEFMADRCCFVARCS
ncbi:hypothetical protein GCM10008957_27330 [Deinococcus ruber]|uniref:Uncharacterized protein n=1 Tax=Deinococcus ruber TaxID=1848197 RepID=A0A918C9R7_9DEIO|nr:hypothetical protein GCM10008957_27330 [Deinococcus ruber]